MVTGEIMHFVFYSRLDEINAGRYNQTQIAEGCGGAVSRSTVNLYMDPTRPILNPNLKAVGALAIFFEVEPWDILTYVLEKDDANGEDAPEGQLMAVEALAS